MSKLVVQLQKEQIPALDPLRQQHPHAVTLVHTKKSLDGASMLQAIVELSKATLPIVVTTLIALASKSKVLKIEIDGKKLEIPVKDELTLDQFEALLKKYILPEDGNGDA